MPPIPGLRRFFRLPARDARQIREDVDDELRFHIEMRTQELVARGLTVEAARREALRHFGDVALVRERCRRIDERQESEMRRTEYLGELRQDVGYAARQLRRSPGFTAVATLILALGIGASTAIFSVVDGVVLRPLPFRDPDQLVRLWEVTPAGEDFSTSDPNFLDWQARNRSFAVMAAYRGASPSLVGSGEPERLRGIAASATLLPMIGATPLLGRTFTDDETRAGGDARVAVVGHGLWQRRFGGDPRIVGGAINLDGSSYTVVGVMRPGYDFPRRAEIWLPLTANPESSRGNHTLAVVARLRPGVSIDQARADLASVASDLAREHPSTNQGYGVRVASFAEWIVGPTFARRLYILLGAVGFVLLIACANVASLLLARATTRAREMGVRAALGAGRGRLVRQLLTESGLLALLGAAGGVLLAYGALPLLRRLSPGNIPRLDEVTIDGRALAFALGAAVITGAIFGLAPALRASRADLGTALKSGGRSVGGAGARLRRALVVAELSLALMLLVGAGLLAASFLRLQQVDPGYVTENVLAVPLSLAAERYPPPRRGVFLREVLARIEAIPGVHAAAATNIGPFSGGSTNVPFTVVGREPKAPGEFLAADWRSVTPGYFRTMGIPLRRGRLLSDADRADAPRVIVIGETMADRIWPGEDPVGRRIEVGGGDDDWTVVGVVGDIRDVTLEADPAPAIFIAYDQLQWQDMTLLLRTTGNAAALAAPVRQAIWAVDRDMPVTTIEPLRASIAAATAGPRFSVFLLGVFAAVALILAAVGIYGVMAFTVAQRTREMGVRLALGATPGRVVRMVLRDGAALALAGVGIGVAAALALTRFLEGLLFGTKPTDLPTFVTVALGMGAVAVLASWIPARRASKVDPIVALRGE